MITVVSERVNPMTSKNDRRATPKNSPGTIRGVVTNDEKKLRSREERRVSAKEAFAPMKPTRSAVTAATTALLRNESRKSWLSKADLYQRKLNPAKGRLVEGSALNENSTTTATGANRKAMSPAT